MTAVSPLAPAAFPATAPVDGVELSAAAAGVRYGAGRVDVMLASCAPGTEVAGVFTKSKTRAAPVLDCEAKLSRGAEGRPDPGAAVIVNAGNANAFTGAAGRDAVADVTGAVAEALDLPGDRVFSSSTGVIGEPLPAERITAVIGSLAAGLGSACFEDAARAIMTTDTFPKGAEARARIGGTTVRVAGIAKGSGMIAPDMATMLVYIFTDARVERGPLQSLLSGLCETTFNAITVDGDTSTSDTLLLFATGAAGNAPIARADGPEAAELERALRSVMTDLAHQVVRDGEGATKFVEVSVAGAASDSDAKRVAMSVANSPLVKTAIAGEDPNWGRVVMAVGKSGAEADRDRLGISFGGLPVAENGRVSPRYREEDAAAHMKEREIRISIDLGLGAGEFTAWTCDLTHGYIDINADYRS